MTFWLITSSPAEGEGRTLEGNCSRWRVRASCVITFALVSMACSVWQISEVVNMKLLHVVKQKFDSGPPDLDKLVQIQPKPKWVLYKTRFFSEKNEVFLNVPTIFTVFEAHCILLYYILLYYSPVYFHYTIYIFVCLLMRVSIYLSPLCLFDVSS